MIFFVYTEYIFCKCPKSICVKVLSNRLYFLITHIKVSKYIADIRPIVSLKTREDFLQFSLYGTCISWIYFWMKLSTEYSTTFCSPRDNFSRYRIHYKWNYRVWLILRTRQYLKRNMSCSCKDTAKIRIYTTI